MRMIAALFAFFSLFNPVCAQNFTAIEVEADTAGKIITYGSELTFRYYTLNKKGKRKLVDYKKIDNHIICTVTGADWNHYQGKLTFAAKTPDKGMVKATIRFTAKNPAEVSLDQAFEIRMNFKSGLTIDGKGATGRTGVAGSGKGKPLLLRDGKDGEPGNAGGPGDDGSRLTVRLKKEYDDYCRREILFVYVMDDSLKTESIYRCPYPDRKLVIDVSGGDGGAGGNGGDGGTGKDGSVADDKRPGDGGNGADGGKGGRGGRGGEVTIIAHTNCGDLLSHVNVRSHAGVGGPGGKGGDAGKPGKPDTGQAEGKTGKPGQQGAYGDPGRQGPQFVLRVEDF